MEKMSVSKLPKTSSVLGRMLSVRDVGHSVKEAIIQVRHELREVWKHHFGIPLVYGKDDIGPGNEKESEKLIIRTSQIDVKLRNLL